MNGMNGLLDWVKTPEGQGVLGGLFGYAASAQRGAPINSIGKGGLAGLLAYSQAGDRQLRQQQEDQERQIRALQLKKAQDELSATDQIRAAARSAYTPATPAAGGVLDSALPPEFQTGATPVPGRPAAFDTKAFLGQVMQIDPIRGMEWQTKLKPESPFGKVDPANFTRESVAKFEQTGNYRDLEPVRKNEIAPNGVVFNPYQVQPGTVFQDPNKPFAAGPNGPVPNLPFQQFELSKATASAPKMPAINLHDPTAVAKAAMGLQNDVRSALKDHFTIADQWTAMQNAVQNPSPQGDTALLYSFFKILDPASTVREGEVAMVKDNRSIPDKYKGLAQKLAGGGTLLPHEREDILNQARRQIEGRIPRVEQDVQAYRDNAKRLGLDPDLYVPHPYGNFKPANQPHAKDAVPLPSANPKATELRKGQAYITPRGVAVWDGFKFTTIDGK